MHQYQQETLASLIGMEVRTSVNKCLGTVKSIGTHTILVSRRLFFDLGPIVCEQAVSIEKIEQIDNSTVRLKPSQAEYWRVPPKKEGEHTLLRRTYLDFKKWTKWPKK